MYQTMADPWTRRRSIKVRYRLDVLGTDGQWCCVCSAFADPEEAAGVEAYIRDQRAKWEASRFFGDTATRIVRVTGRAV